MPRQTHPATEPIIILLALGLIALLISASYALFQNAGNHSGADFSSNIRQILDQDAHHFRDIRAKQQVWNPSKVEDIRALSVLGAAYHEEISQIDLSRCPEAFRAAYQAHTTTWKVVAKNLAEVASSAPELNYDTRKALGAKVREITRPLEQSWSAVRVAAEEHGIYIRD